MTIVKKVMNTPPPRNNNTFYIFLILVSLAVNAYLLLYKQDKQQQSLVKVGDTTFRWKDISAPGKKMMSNLDSNYYNLLKREADIWVENQILPKEAQALSITVSDLMNKQVGGQAQISEVDVYRRYVQSPQADLMPWPQVLKEIENEMRGHQYQENKEKYMESLHAKYGVRYHLKSPSGDGQATVKNSRFPVYTRSAPPAPLRGASNAPVQMDVFSDFMCPFSVRFHSTLQELQKQYPDKLQISFRHFPLPFHQGAHLMSEASLCAEEQGKFWEYHDKLLIEAKKREKSELVQIASDLGLSSPKFVECLDSGRHVKKVDEDIAFGKSNGVQGTPGFLINGRRGSGAMSVDMMKPLIDWHLNPSGVYPGKPKEPAQQPGKGGQRQAPQGLDPAKIYPIDAVWLKKGFSRGPENAPVTLVEFFDYNCPFCKKGAEVSDGLLALYGDKLRVVSKHLPLPMHPNAVKTAESILCANEQSKSMEYRKEVLGEFWGKSTADDLKAIAQKIGLDTTAFNACYDSGKMRAVVDEDMIMANSIGVQSTPTFMVNGSPVVGAQPIEAFKKTIDEKLSAPKK